ncbi:MAG: hypothetical protein JWQ09_1535 [Segetibacter sp.]|nr:hypothetical protein [Segetibacter sp.]
MKHFQLMQTKVVFFCYLILVASQVCGQDFTSVRSDEGIEIRENGKKVLFYQVRPKSVDGKFERAGYIHPLYSLNEKSLTDDMPKDHPYHRGIFWAWHQIIKNNKPIAEGWVSENISWEPVKVKVNKNKKSIMLQSEMLWKSALEHNVPEAIIRENTKIKVYRSTTQYRIIDFDIQLFPLVDSLKIGGSDDEKGYGGFCLRLKLPEDISFVSEDKLIIPQETAVVAGPWMDITGTFEGSSLPKTGVIVFGNPSGSVQQPWILRKVTSMQNVPYPGRTPIPLPKSGLKLKYRIVIHNGKMNNEQIEKLYKQYITKH